MFRTLSRGALLALTAVLAAVGAVHADAAPPIVGVVRDSDGAPLPNARVVIDELNRSTLSGREGAFVFRALRPGTYHLDVTLLGYAPGHAVVTVPPEGPEVRVEIVMRSTVLSLEGINVTASPRSADPLNITQSTVELSGKALERSMGTTVAQTLSSQPGLSVRYGGPAASTPVIRGLSGERVLVVQNGQRTGDLSSTSPDHALSVDPLAASRIEVVRGPASLLYGNNALGGVVNVISTDIPTTIPGQAQGFLAAQGESVNPGGAVTGEVTLPLGETLALSARGGGRRVGDVHTGGGDELENTSYDNLYGTAGVGYVGEGVQGGASVGAYRFDYGLPSPPGAEEAGVSIDGQRVDANGRVDVALGDRGLTNLRVDGTAQWYGHDEIEPTGEVGTRFRLDTQTGNVTAKTRMGRLDGAVGVSALFKQYSPEGEEALTPGAQSRTAGVFVYQELPLGGGDLAPSLQVGGRYDVYRVEPEETDDERFTGVRTRDFSNVSGSLGVNVPLSGELSASVSVARSFRAPTVEELFSNAFHHAAGTYDIGDPELELEVNRGAEAVLRGQSQRVNAQVAVFYSRIDNYITPEVVGDTLIEHHHEHEDHEEGEEEEEMLVPLNRFRQADAELRGLEGQIEAVVGGNVVLGVMGDLVRGDFVDGGVLPFMPASRLGASARWDDGRYSLGVEARHAFEQTRAEPEEFRTDDYTLVNANAGVSLRGAGRIHSIVLRVDNVLDELYREPTSRLLVPSPGRNVSLVYRVLF